MSLSAVAFYFLFLEVFQVTQGEVFFRLKLYWYSIYFFYILCSIQGYVHWAERQNVYTSRTAVRIEINKRMVYNH